ncbi:MAG: hypothetical protein ACLFQL_10485 [Paracoccaceae bacterium]
MSDSDSFIQEVTEEVRRDRLFRMLRRYGWIAVLAVLLIVGGAAWNEWRKGQAAEQAQATGDAILDALEQDAAEQRIAALDAIEPEQPGARAIVALLKASELGAEDDDEAAAEVLDEVGMMGEDLPAVYRQIAAFKAILRRDEALSLEERRLALEALASPGAPLRLLAEEQLALIEIEAGETEAAEERLQAILEDSEVTQGLRRRASQLIVALGGEPGARATDG